MLLSAHGELAAQSYPAKPIRVLAMPQMKENMNRDGTELAPTTLAQSAELIRAMAMKAE